MRIGIRGVATSGKSTLVASLIGNDWAIAIDADQRFEDQAYISPNVTRVISSDLTELAAEVGKLKNPPKAKKNEPQMVKRDYKWLVIDSITHILSPIIAKMMYDNSNGKSYNNSAGSMDKASAMRIVQGYGLGIENIAYIWHLEESTFFEGGQKKTKMRSTLPDVEWERLKHDCHALFNVEMVKKDGKTVRTLVCEWCRFDDGGVIMAGGQRLVDGVGKWQGMGARIKKLLVQSQQGYGLEYLSLSLGKPVGELKAKLNGKPLPANTDYDGWVAIAKSFNPPAKEVAA